MKLKSVSWLSRGETRLKLRCIFHLVARPRALCPRDCFPRFRGHETWHGRARISRFGGQPTGTNVAEYSYICHPINAVRIALIIRDIFSPLRVSIRGYVRLSMPLGIRLANVSPLVVAELCKSSDELSQTL